MIDECDCGVCNFLRSSSDVSRHPSMQLQHGIDERVKRDGQCWIIPEMVRRHRYKMTCLEASLYCIYCIWWFWWLEGFHRNKKVTQWTCCFSREHAVLWLGFPVLFVRYILQSFELYLFADVQEPQTLLQPQNVGTYTNTFEMNRKTNTWNSHK